MNMERENSFKGEIPYIPLENEKFSEFFFERAQRIEEEMKDMYFRVSNKSRAILRMDIYPKDEKFKAYVCPVKVMRGKEMQHPMLLTYCMWRTHKQMLYWPMDMIPLTNEERCSIWNDFVKDDEGYYAAREY